MDVRYRQNIPVILTLIVISASLVLSLRCMRCSLNECMQGDGGVIEECSPEKTDCATSILRHGIGNLRGNTVLERYCYSASARNKLYRRNVPHCQKNDRANVEICVCPTDGCNAKLPPCNLRNYGNGRTCSRT